MENNENIKRQETEPNSKTKLPRRSQLLLVIGMTASVGTIILALLYIFGVMDSAMLIAMPLMGITMLTQAVQLWKTKSHKVAVFSLVVAIFIFAVTVFNIIVRLKMI